MACEMGERGRGGFLGLDLSVEFEPIPVGKLCTPSKTINTTHHQQKHLIQTNEQTLTTTKQLECLCVAKGISLSYDIVGFIFQTAFWTWDVQKKLFTRKQ